MNDADDPPADAAGYGKPPKSGRFRKGHSGNPRGRPKGSRRDIPYDRVLGHMVTIREGGEEREITAAEAFLLYLTKRGLEGDMAAARLAAEAFDACNKTMGPTAAGPETMIISWIEPDSPSSVLRPLQMAVKHNRFTADARMLIEPWLIEAALARLGDRRLAPDEQAVVLATAHTPHKVKWPDWWEVSGDF